MAQSTVLETVEAFKVADNDKQMMDLDRRVTVLEVKTDEHFRSITEIKNLMDKLHEKLDVLIQSQTATKAKVAIMYAGYGVGIVGLIELLVNLFVFHK